MAHKNFAERRGHVHALMDRDGAISATMVRDLTQQFGCSKTAIYRDIANYRDPATMNGYRDVEVANVQNNRARRLGIEGTFTSQEWRALRNRYGNRCVICGERKPLGPDHIRPLSKGGTNWIGNIQPMCQPCNSSKRARWSIDGKLAAWLPIEDMVLAQRLMLHFPEARNIDELFSLAIRRLAEMTDD